MQCPVCAAEIKSDDVSCPSCGAMRITGGSPIGVMVGWAGVTMAVMMICMWSILLVLPLTDAKMSDFPWMWTSLLTLVTVGLLWYSRSTRKPRWIPR